MEGGVGDGGEPRRARGLVAIEVAFAEALVARRDMVAIDDRSLMLDQRAGEREPRVLIPRGLTDEVAVGEQERDP